MLYMKEMRAKVVAECTLKESAAINQILGRKVRPSGYPSLEKLYSYTQSPLDIEFLIWQSACVSNQEIFCIF